MGKFRPFSVEFYICVPAGVPEQAERRNGKMEKLRFMLIGCGRISKNHIAAAAANQDSCELVAVCGPVGGVGGKKEKTTYPSQEKTGRRARTRRPPSFSQYGQMVSTFSRLVLPDRPLVMPPVMTISSPGESFMCSLAAFMAV